MKAFGLLALIAVVAVGAYIYTKQVQSTTSVAGGAPTTAIDVTAVRADLLALANAERQYFASNGKYVSLDQLQADGTRIPSRPNYSYSAEAGEANFKIIATYSGPDPKAPKSIAIDDTMAITTN
jgi:uncharacterized protein (UPF0333 family)